MDISSGMLVGKWSSSRNILNLMRGDSGERIILCASVRAAAGTGLIVDGQDMTVPESGVLRDLLPKEELRIRGAEKVHAKIEYQFEEDML